MLECLVVLSKTQAIDRMCSRGMTTSGLAGMRITRAAPAAKWQDLKVERQTHEKLHFGKNTNDLEMNRTSRSI